MAERTSIAPVRGRKHTRALLLDAALAVFAEDGFGRSSVEKVCERAGFTRGAFYSNFDSLDQLFLAMWEHQSEQMLVDVHAAIGKATTPHGPDAAPSAENMTVRASVARVLAAIPVDERWYRITAEFSAHALRHPELAQVVVAREHAIRDALMPFVEEELARAGRRVVDRELLGRALVALHDGTTVQCVMEPAETARLALRTELFTALLLAFSTPATAPAPHTACVPNTATTHDRQE